MKDLLTELYLYALLMLAIGFGGYTWGTPGSNPWQAVASGAFTIAFIMAMRSDARRAM